MIEQGQEYLERDGNTLVFVAIDSLLVATLAIHDPIKPDARNTVEIIKQMGKKVRLDMSLSKILSHGR